MKELLPHKLKNMHEVAEYWAQCLRFRSTATDDKDAAAWLVGVISNDKDEEWSEGEDADPLYSEVFELAADMEWQDGTPEWRKESWNAIERYVRALQEKYPE